MEQYNQDEKWKTLMGLREVIQEEIKQLGGHLVDKPSTATLNMINDLKISNKEFETNQKNMMNEIQEMKSTAKETLITNNLAHEKIEKAVVDSETRITELFKEFEKKVDRIMASKANKWVERLMVWAGGILGAAGLVILVGLIVQAIIHFYRP